jgi:N-acetylmuramoyl-L-alanine amidase
MRQINEIIVHCSATPEGADFKVEDIDKWHRKRGFRCIGYHYVIYLDGGIHLGRPIEEEGAHCLGHNIHSIGVCYIGGVAKDGHTPKDTRTPEQKEALKALLGLLKAAFRDARIYGHRDFAKKDCPSFDATKEYLDISNTNFKSALP